MSHPWNFSFFWISQSNSLLLPLPKMLMDTTVPSEPSTNVGSDSTLAAVSNEENGEIIVLQQGTQATGIFSFMPILIQNGFPNCEPKYVIQELKALDHIRVLRTKSSGCHTTFLSKQTNKETRLLLSGMAYLLS
jgi:hypothetical protein